MAIPVWQQVGSNFTAATAIQAILPGTVNVDDILLCGVESNGTDPPPFLADTGNERWDLVETVVQGGTRATLFICRATRTFATFNPPVVSDSGDHQQGRVHRISGCHTDGPPSSCIHRLDKFYDPTSDVSGSFASALSTTVAECLIVYFCVGDLPDANGTAEHSAQANANLGTVTERSDNSVATGNGGSTMWATGTLAAAGAIGTFTYTKVNAAVKTGLMVALMPPQGDREPFELAQQHRLTPSFVGPGVDRVPSGRQM